MFISILHPQLLFAANCITNYDFICVGKCICMVHAILMKQSQVLIQMLHVIFIRMFWGSFCFCNVSIDWLTFYLFIYYFIYFFIYSFIIIIFFIKFIYFPKNPFYGRSMPFGPCLDSRNVIRHFFQMQLPLGHWCFINTISTDWRWCTVICCQILGHKYASPEYCIYRLTSRMMRSGDVDVAWYMSMM